jgi:hypothetical protein
MSELISMCVEEEERIKAEKPDFTHAVTDGPKLKKIKDNGKGKNKADMILMLTKQVCLVQNILLSVIIIRNVDT